VRYAEAESAATANAKEHAAFKINAVSRLAAQYDELEQLRR
jgi:hypothetical protein